MKFSQPKISTKYACFEKGAYASKSAKHYLNNEFDPNRVKKVAVIRHAALGDQVITRPFLIEARKFFPNAEITLVALSTYQYGMPSDLADRTVVLHGRDKKEHVTSSEKFANFKEVGDQDVIFDLACTNRSYWVNLLNKAKLKIGFPYKAWLRGTLYNAAVFRSDLSPEVETMLDMLRILGHNPVHRLDFGYPDHKELVNNDKPYIVYFNGASQPRKVLKNEQMADLLQSAVTHFPQYQHVFLEGVKDNEKGDYLKVLTEEHDNFSIQPCLPLDALLHYCAAACLVVAPDTGVRNVAISTHTPTVGIFYATVPFRYTPRYEPIHHIVMNADTSIPTTVQIIQCMESAGITSQH
ncbi:glycosyltransferase family 9 protein [Enterovibrio nigricans]|uniref:ADP-heptose:LPS heptosyltransferase n=1 Tax=Enterovibrio nigricans DSM 22720 TaxID=1121868 RepID=A0A1T4UHS7_9GAMM|nr:glycosyltransferase family 9 protein [Enterovibrio nigricans]PKF51305.1 lipopolysaccharide heptosyltransferase family protein [Enterovibrio nigricans]SKA52021.1 ADP-heptose:LPS heptosyltransferase [Enterovibrio nigricans DSM 22720]